MVKFIHTAEVAEHNSLDSCWIILHGQVYDVTYFLPQHPGGSSAILQLAGTDATEDFDPVHPPGTLKQLMPEANLGLIDADTLTRTGDGKVLEPQKGGPVRLNALLNLEEIEAEATKRISRKAWAYYYSASDDLESKLLNHEVYRSILLRPRIFIDCEDCSFRTSFLGCNIGTPIYVAPAAMARLAHPAGEKGIAQACSMFGALQIISNNASMSPEQICADSKADQVFGWQLYAQSDRKKSEAMLARINQIPNIRFVVLTLDAPVPGKREDDERSSNIGSTLSVPSSVHVGSASKPSDGPIGKALFAGTSPKLTWSKTLPWLASQTKLPIVLKGVQTHEDAYIASLHTNWIKGIILSNHGGRAVDTAPPALHTLLEIRKYCPEVLSRLDVLVDGGIKRGTDVVKALCLGAKGVGIGRAALWGLGAGGVAGVERTFESLSSLLNEELATAMRLLGANDVSQLGIQHVNTRTLEQQIYDGLARLRRSEAYSLSKL